ncbi:MAG TPA: hypothetical protein O0X23_05405 [Methanocorpusculum sp.]|nr:hypothetical protein [Methanocorpusculum sp.]
MTRGFSHTLGKNRSFSGCGGSAPSPIIATNLTAAKMRYRIPKKRCSTCGI